MEYIDHFGFYNDASRYESHSHLSCEIIGFVFRKNKH